MAEVSLLTLQSTTLAWLDCLAAAMECRAPVMKVKGLAYLPGGRRRRCAAIADSEKSRPPVSSAKNAFLADVRIHT